MKTLNKYINENQSQLDKGSKFNEQVKYSKEDWEKWLKLIDKEEYGKDLLIGNYEESPELILVYKVNHDKKMMDHIASYNSKKEILYTDDINLFGNLE